MMFFEQVLEVNDQKRIVLRVLNMILNLFFCYLQLQFLAVFSWIRIRKFCPSRFKLRKKSPIRIRNRNTAKSSKKSCLLTIQVLQSVGGGVVTVVTGTGTQHNNFYTEISTVQLLNGLCQIRLFKPLLWIQTYTLW